MSMPWNSACQCISEADWRREGAKWDNYHEFRNIRANTHVKIFEKIAATTSETSYNFLISPVSIWNMFIILRVGAEGVTAIQLDHLLNNAIRNKPSLVLFFALSRDERRYGSFFRIANKIFRNVFMHFKGCLLDIPDFHLQSHILPFKNLTMTVKSINHWVEIKTNHQINNIIRDDDVKLNPSSLLVVSVAYFSCAWHHSLTFNIITNGTFFTKPNDPVSVVMMTATHQLFRVGYDSILSCWAVELPYVVTNMSMFILLPNTTVENLLPKLTNERLFHLISSLKYRHLTLTLPKFKIEYSLDVKDYLIQRGINVMFNPNSSNFKTFTGNMPSHIGYFAHKVSIEVNQRGTNIPENTNVKPNSSDHGNTNHRKTFHCNKPFVFIIRENSAPQREILLSGIIRYPQY